MIDRKTNDELITKKANEVVTELLNSEGFEGLVQEAKDMLAVGMTSMFMMGAEYQEELLVSSKEYDIKP
jgi:hypothetical protein